MPRTDKEMLHQDYDSNLEWGRERQKETGREYESDLDSNLVPTRVFRKIYLSQWNITRNYS